MWYLNHSNLTVHFPSLIVLVVCVFSYFIVSAFMTVYKMTIDTLVICFCEDAANIETDQFMSKRLKKVMTNEERRHKAEHKKQEENEKAALIENEHKYTVKA